MTGLAAIPAPEKAVSRASGTVARPPSTGPERVGWSFIALYVAAYMGTCLVLIAPVLVTLALKVKTLVGPSQAPGSLALVTGLGAVLAMVGNPLFGRLSDRTTARVGMRRPWMVIGLAGGSVGLLVVAVAPNITVVLAGWCLAQLSFNALLAAQVAVLPDQVPVAQRGLVSGVLGVCLPIAAASGTFVVQLFSGNQVAMFLAPCAIGGVFILLFAARLDDRQLPRERRPAWSLRELLATFYVAPRRNPDFAWAFVSRFTFVLAYAFLTTYQTYFLLDKIGSSEADVPHQIFLGTAAQSVVVVAASLLGGRLSDRTQRRKRFVVAASVIYGLALFGLAAASSFNGYLVGMAISGAGFGLYMAVDLALVADVLPDSDSAGKDLGVLNIAGAVPFFAAPAVAPGILAVAGGSYAVLYGVAGACAIGGAVAVLRVNGVR
jgi:MFS family permease